MKSIRLVVPVIALVLALLPSTALASTTYTESVLGVETGPPQSTLSCQYPNSVSSFAGIARGNLNGGFQIAVCHTPLAPSAEILGGTFILSNGTLRLRDGQFLQRLLRHHLRERRAHLSLRPAGRQGTISLLVAGPGSRAQPQVGDPPALRRSSEDQRDK